MLSRKVLTLIDYQFRLATTVKSVPFGWDNRRSIIKLIPLRRRSIGYYLSWLNIVLDFSVSGMSCVGYFHSIAINLSNKAAIIPLVLYTGVLLLVSLLSVLLNMYQVEFMTLANKLLQNNTNVTKELQLHGRRDVALEWFWKAGAVLNVATPAVLYSFCMDPDGNGNLYTFYGGTDLHGKRVFAIASAAVLANKWIVIQTMATLVFALMLTLRVWLRIMLSKFEKDELKPQQAIAMHNCIQIFSAMNRSTFTWLIFPVTLAAASVIAVVSLATLIVYHKHMPTQILAIILEAIVIALVGLHVAFELIREATHDSHQLLTNLNLRCQHSPYLRRRVKACIPYSILFGNLFKAKAVTVLTVFGLIVQNTISLVILKNN